MGKNSKRKLVFVVGAGASVEFGFPVGQTIAHDIQNLLDAEFREGLPEIGRGPITAALGTSSRDEEYKKAARQLRAGIGAGETIDQFLMRRRNNSHVRNLGLMTLAHVILNAERNSPLMGYDAENFEGSLNALRSTANSWPAILMEHLIGVQSPEDISSESFREIAFIIFNYDRCVQQTFVHRLYRQHELPFHSALNIVNSIPMVHVYGTLGEIDGSVPYGAQNAPLADISKTLRTYHDGVVDKEHAERIHSLVDGAEKIIFLGFGFHRENVKLLFKSQKKNARTIGTAMHLQNVPPFSDFSNATGSEFFPVGCTQFLRENGFSLMSKPWSI